VFFVGQTAGSRIRALAPAVTRAAALPYAGVASFLAAMQRPRSLRRCGGGRCQYEVLPCPGERIC
jgi:hypothetical protein